MRARRAQRSATRGSAGPAWLILVGLGCATNATPSAEAPTSAVGAFRAGDAVGYVVRDADGRVVGRVHSRFLARGEQRTVVTRAVFGPPALDLARLSPDRTTERATTLRADGSIHRLKLLSSTDGLRTFTYRNGSVLEVGRAQSRRSRDSNPKAVPIHADDPALTSVVLENLALEPGRSARIPVRAKGPVAVQTWPIQVFSGVDRRTVVRLPWGEAVLDRQGRIARLRTRDGRTYEQQADAGPAPELMVAPEPLVYRRPAGARWVDRPVRIDVTDGILAGVLSAPPDSRPNGVPGVVFVSDRGPQDRHGFGAGIDHGTWAVLDRLVESGFAVLRLDDRGVGGSRSRRRRGTIDAALAAADARAALAFMAAQPEVVPDQLFVLAHGFGALEAAVVADSEAVRGLALLGPAARSPSSVLAEQWASLHGGDASAHRAEIETILRTLREGRALGRSETARRIGDDGRRLATAPALTARLRRLDVPVAVFQGMKDFEVSWRNDAQALVKGINGRRGKRAKLFVYEDVDHLMKRESRLSSPARYRDRTRQVETRVLDDLVAWFNERL